MLKDQAQNFNDFVGRLPTNRISEEINYVQKAAIISVLVLTSCIPRKDETNVKGYGLFNNATHALSSPEDPMIVVGTTTLNSILDEDPLHRP